MELTTTWKEEGRREGEQAGKQAEALALTRRLLTRRFGALAPEVDTRIGALSLPQVETLAEDLLDFTSPDDLRAWLDTHPPEPDASGQA
jgi:predicted transposase YdaD